MNIIRSIARYIFSAIMVQLLGITGMETKTFFSYDMKYCESIIKRRREVI